MLKNKKADMKHFLILISIIVFFILLGFILKNILNRLTG